MAADIALVFPGQGSQSIGMLAEHAADSKLIKDSFDEASEGAGIDLWTLSQQGPKEQLDQTEFTQPALLAAGVAVWRLWSERAPAKKPAFLAGHSLGEYGALVAAGALSLADGARLVRERGKLMQASVPAGVGAMAAVLGAEDALVEKICLEVSDQHVVVPANYNSPGQIVIGGHAQAVDRAIAALAEQGVRKTVKLAVSVPSHTPLMRDAAMALGEFMQTVPWSVPALPVMQNVDGRSRQSIEDIQQALVQQLYAPVRWTQCIEALRDHGATTIFECGPGKVLTGLCKRIDKSLQATALGMPEEFAAAAA